MPYFIFQVKDDAGRLLNGLIEARNENEARRKVVREDYFFISAKPCRKEEVFSRKVPSKSLLMFTQRLMSMMDAGIPVLGVINILWRQTEDPTIQLVVSHIKAQLEEGSQISTAMDDFPKIFFPVYRSLIRVGEVGGSLVPIMRKLADYLDYQEKLIDRVKKATLYPVFVIIFSFIVIMGLFAFVVPTFQKVLLKLNVPLPAITKTVLFFSSLIRSPWFMISLIFLVIVGIVAFNYCKKDAKLGIEIDKLIFKIPLFGDIFYVFSLSHVVRSLSILLGAGVPIMASLNMACDTSGNKATAAQLNSVKEQIEQGRSMYESFRSIKQFPVMLVEMIGIGESSGMMVDVLEKVTKYFDEDVDYRLNRVLTILEPVLVIIVGGIIVVTLLAIYLPIVSIWQGLMAAG
jgi:type IV pilus assembly protein PilC